MLPDNGALEIKDEQDGATRQRDECEEQAGPLVIQSVDHLACEEDDAGTPERSQECFGGEGQGGLVLVRVHCSICESNSEDDLLVPVLLARGEGETDYTRYTR